MVISQTQSSLKKQNVSYKPTACMVAIASLCLFCTTASAKELTFYGIVDTGVEVVTNVGTSGATLTRVPTVTGSMSSRLGLKGKSDIVNGYSGVFTVEAGLAPDSGTSNQSGRPFGRQLFAGIAAPWGTVTAGRQYTQTLLNLVGDTMGPSIHTASALDPYLAQARVDNSVSYQGAYGSFKFGVTYSTGRDTTGSIAAGGCVGENATDINGCRDVSYGLQYNTKTWGVGASSEKMNGGAGSGPLPFSSQTDTRNSVSGYVNIDAGKVGAGYIRRVNYGATAPVTNYWFVGGKFPSGQMEYDFQYGYLTTENSSDGGSSVVARALYNFDQQTAVYASFGHVSNRGSSTFTVDGGSTSGSAPAAGQGQSGLMVGARYMW